MYVRAFFSICTPLAVPKSVTTQIVKKCTEFPLTFSSECLLLKYLMFDISVAVISRTDKLIKPLTLLKSLCGVPAISRKVGSSVVKIR